MNWNEGIDLGDFTISPREIIASISIIMVMLLLGFHFSGKVSDTVLDKQEEYNQAIKITDKDLFVYGMETNVGNAFVYGPLEAVDPVSYPEIKGEYMYIEKIKEKYTMHTRTVTKYRSVGGRTESYTEIETYWTWDEVNRESLKCKKITFLGVEFDSNRIETPATSHIETIKVSGDVRFKYYGTEKTHVGTIYTQLKDKTISERTPFYENFNIEETLEMKKADASVFLFWFFWILLTGGVLYAFYYLENDWLE